MAQITRTDTRVCFFLALADIAAHLGDQIAPKPQFLGCEYVFSSQTQEFET